jgi:spoIIIJ-associated protein
MTDEMLQQQALDAATELKRWGEPVTLPPMNAAERRIVHIALQEQADIQSESIGDGARKQIVISLKK